MMPVVAGAEVPGEEAKGHPREVAAWAAQYVWMCRQNITRRENCRVSS